MTSLVYLGASLTLPGIAGIALTIGMAVDANVLINERIKEELRLGRKLIAAIDVGYQKAMATIIDSNLTTLIGACLLYYFGTGSVRGFGVTLSLGIIISMFTAVSLSRVFVYLWVTMKRPKKLWI
jgi:preprotein translocase subunit SecD